jgi:hypothetical protein
MYGGLSVGGLGIKKQPIADAFQAKERSSGRNGRSAQPALAADRCARKIVRILKASAGALAAPECQPVRPP